MNIKKTARLLIAAAVIVLFIFMLTACAAQKTDENGSGTSDATDKPATTEQVATDTPATEEPVVTDIPATEIPATEVPATEVPATEIPATDEPAPSDNIDPTENTDPTDGTTPTDGSSAIASGTNVALDAEVDVSTTTGESHASIGFGPEHLNDGYYYEPTVPSVGWTTNIGENYDDPYQEEWALLTLAQDTSINKIMVYPVVNGGRFPVAFQLQVSTDGKNFTTVAEVKDNSRFDDKDDSPFEFEFEAVNCRYVRFLATELCDPSPSDGYLCQVAEIEIYAA